MKTKKSNAIICPFNEYLDKKNQWIKNNPGAIIIEEVKTLTMQQVEMPATTLIKSTAQPQVQILLLIAWAFIYEIEEIIQPEAEKFPSWAPKN